MSRQYLENDTWALGTKITFMIKLQSHFLLLMIILSIVLLASACTHSSEKIYTPKNGEPNLLLLNGNWKGITHSGNSDFQTETQYLGELEMNGETAGELDILYFKPINPDGSLKVGGWVDKLYISNGNLSYLMNDYSFSKWSQHDSTNFKWFLLGTDFWDNKIGNYKNFVNFERNNDSLHISTGQLVLDDSVFNINYYTRSGKLQ